jgi:hypothetical protein
MVNSKNRTNTRTVEQTLVNVSSQSVNVNCPPPTPGLRLPALAPPRARDRVARHSLRPARALERPSRASVLFEKVARLQTDAKQRVLRPLRDVLGRVDEDASGDEGEAEEDETVEIEDELKAYLELPQLKCKTEQEAIDWWVEKSKRFPNLSAMARQYLGCPATSATVERLFSRVGIAFSAKRKSSDPATVADLMFANANLP